MEIRPEGPVLHVGRVLAQAGRDAPVEAAPDLRLVEQVLRGRVEDPRVTADDLRQQRAAGAQHATRLSQRVASMGGVNQVIHRAHQQHDIGAAVRRGKLTRVSESSREGRSVRRAGALGGRLDVPIDRVDERDLVPAAPGRRRACRARRRRRGRDRSGEGNGRRCPRCAAEQDRRCPAPTGDRLRRSARSGASPGDLPAHVPVSTPAAGRTNEYRRRATLAGAALRRGARRVAG